MCAYVCISYSIICQYVPKCSINNMDTHVHVLTVALTAARTTVLSNIDPSLPPLIRYYLTSGHLRVRSSFLKKFLYIYLTHVKRVC